MDRLDYPDHLYLTGLAAARNKEELSNSAKSRIARLRRRYVQVVWQAFQLP